MRWRRTAACCSKWFEHSSVRRKRERMLVRTTPRAEQEQSKIARDPNRIQNLPACSGPSHRRDSGHGTWALAGAAMPTTPLSCGANHETTGTPTPIVEPLECVPKGSIPHHGLLDPWTRRLRLTPRPLLPCGPTHKTTGTPRMELDRAPKQVPPSWPRAGPICDGRPRRPRRIYREHAAPPPYVRTHQPTCCLTRHVLSCRPRCSPEIGGT